MAIIWRERWLPSSITRVELWAQHFNIQAKGVSMVILSDFYKAPLPQDDGIKEKEPKVALIEWNVAFNPTVGRCYEVFFSRKGTEGTELQNSARIRVDGEDTSKWIDLSTQEALRWPLNSPFVVQGSREINDPDDGELDREDSIN